MRMELKTGAGVVREERGKMGTDYLSIISQGVGQTARRLAMYSLKCFTNTMHISGRVMKQQLN